VCARDCGLLIQKYQLDIFAVAFLALPVGKLIIHTKKIKAQAQNHGSEVRALHHMQLCQCATLFPGTRFSFHKGHNSWHTLYFISLIFLSTL
jgi:hypothetical protein